MFAKSLDNSCGWVNVADVKLEYLMQVLRDMQGKDITYNHQQFGGGQNLGLYELMAHQAMAWKTTTVTVSVHGRNISVK